MLCPFCKIGDTKVIDSRFKDSITKRRRLCTTCDRRITTSETVVHETPSVVKRDGRLEPFIGAKIRTGLLLALVKRRVAYSAILECVHNVESKAYDLMPTVEIGMLVLEELKTLDEVGYIRFASVFYNFQSKADFN